MNKKEQIEITKERLKELQAEQKKIDNPSIGDIYFWYEYDQNNSGGSFIDNEQVCECVYVEATTLDEANSFADSLGIYFDGVDSGEDCSCCGDRWSEPYESVSFPYRYGTFTLSDVKKIGFNYEKTTWVQAGKEKPDKNKYDIIFENINQMANYYVNKSEFDIYKKVYIYDRKRVKTIIGKGD